MRLILVLLLIAAAFAAALIFAPRYDYDTVLTLPTAASDGAPGGAPDDAFVSLGGPGEDVDMTCPVGIEFAGKDLVLLDADTLRALAIDVETGKLKRADPLGLPEGTGARAMASGDGALWVVAQSSVTGLSGTVPFVETESGRLEKALDPAAAADGEPGLSLGTSAALPEGEAARRLSDLGFSADEPDAATSAASDPSAPSEASDASGAEAAPAGPVSWSDAVASPSGAAYPVAFAAAGKTLRIDLAAPGGASATFDISGARTILSAYLLTATEAGDVFASVAAWDPDSPVVDVAKAVYGLNVSRPRPVVYDVPLEEGDCVAKQNVAVSESGEVYALKVRMDGVSVLRLKPRSRLTDLVRRFDDRFGKVLPRMKFSDVAGAILPSARAQTTAAAVVNGRRRISRVDVVGNACAYLNHPWRPTAANLNVANWSAAPELDKALCTCGSSGSCWRWRAPDGIAADNVERRRLPYNWGGADRLEDFDRKIRDGRPAGDECTLADPISTTAAKDRTTRFAAGVDCSGFVQRAWGEPGAGRKYSTRNLGTFADQVAIKNMLPGDVFNKPSCDRCADPAAPSCTCRDPSGHVRMLLDWVPMQNGVVRLKDKIMFIESTTDRVCNGVCVKAGGYKLEEMVGVGRWTALRSRMVDDAGPPVTNAILCR